MDLSSLLKLLWRRKRVVIPATLVVGALLAVTLIVWPPPYRANSTVVLLPPLPPETGQPSFSNPYVRFGDISVVVDVLKRIMMSDPVVEGLRGDGLHGTFTVSANVDFARGPIIDIVAEADSEADTIADIGLIGDELGRRLAALQKAQGTDRRYFITSKVVVPATKATPALSSMIRRLLVALALGIGFVIGMAVAADALAHRTRRRSQQPAPTALKSPPEAV